MAHSLLNLVLPSLVLPNLARVAALTVALGLVGISGVERSQLAQAAQRAPIASVKNLKLSGQRWIEIDLSGQRLYAWEGDRQVYAILVSTGKPSTPTPTGTFAIQTRHRYTRMQGDDYDVADVPYTMYYHGGYAIHGAYWHNRFGTPMSHGCTNVAVNHARWLFYWASIGTPVVVRE